MGPLRSLTIQNPFNLKDSVTDKETILDIKAEDEYSRLYNVEMQLQGNSLFANRSLYYWAKSYSAQLGTGDAYKKLSPVICLNILDFVLFEPSPRVHNCFALTEQTDTKMILTDHQLMHFLCLTTFRKTRYTESRQLNDWLIRNSL